MYVSSSAPIPDISIGPINPVKGARYNARKQAVFLSVASAASRYDCASQPQNFDNFGTNFLYQVQRARDLINQVGTALSSAFPVGAATGLPAVASVQDSLTSFGASNTPNIVPWSPTTTNPTVPPPELPANFVAPHWGDAATAGARIPVALTAAARNPWFTLGVIGALALAAGILQRGGPGLGGRR